MFYLILKTLVEHGFCVTAIHNRELSVASGKSQYPITGVYFESGIFKTDDQSHKNKTRMRQRILMRKFG